MRFYAAAAVLLLFLAGCSDAPETARFEPSEHNRVATPTQDAHSFANANQVRTRHLHLSLEVNFVRKQLIGTAEYTLDFVQEDAEQIVFDTDYLTIERVEAFDGTQWFDTVFVLGNRDQVLGSPLYVDLPAGSEKVRIHYASSPNATGLDWVDPAGTAGGEYPFLYSQSQPHYARTWIPIQDTPAERFTFTGELYTPAELIGLMGANNPPHPERTGYYQFESTQPIPSYLMAIAVGDLAFAELNERMAIYAEPSVIDAAVAEFGYTTDMMDATEALFGPYAWDRYDQIVLPPSFPWGGMENPQLAFLTPTVIAGDQSLVSLIAHELAHSWSGNLVTNASWRDLWLNEGFTSYVENRIMEAVYGEERALMERMLDAQSLVSAIAGLTERQQVLYIELGQRDPDTVFTSVPYTKAQQFLFFLEDRFGRERFDAFVRQYFADFAFQSVNTDQFRTYLQANLLAKYAGVVSLAEVDEWLYQPGLPDTMRIPEVDAFVKVDAAVAAWLAGDTIEKGAWSIHERIYFLRQLPADMSSAQLERLDEEFTLTASGNNQVLSTWLPIAIRHNYAPAMPRVEQMLTSMGRNSMIAPVYGALVETPAGHARAVAIYEQAKPRYHQLTRNAVEAILYPE